MHIIAWCELPTKSQQRYYDCVQRLQILAPVCDEVVVTASNDPSQGEWLWTQLKKDVPGRISPGLKLGSRDDHRVHSRELWRNVYRSSLAAKNELGDVSRYFLDYETPLAKCVRYHDYDVPPSEVADAARVLNNRGLEGSEWWLWPPISDIGGQPEQVRIQSEIAASIPSAKVISSDVMTPGKAQHGSSGLLPNSPPAAGSIIYVYPGDQWWPLDSMVAAFNSVEPRTGVPILYGWQHRTPLDVSRLAHNVTVAQATLTQRWADILRRDARSLLEIALNLDSVGRK